MKKLFILFLALLFAFPAAAEFTPDNINVSDYYVSYFDGYFHILYFFGPGFSSGQVSISKLENRIHDGPTPVSFIPDAYYETSGSDITIKEERFSDSIYAFGTAGKGFMDLTLDGENYYHFTFLPSNNEIIEKTDLFADVRDRFDEGFTVPAGLYVIGEDLPSGVFSFSSETGCTIKIQQNNLVIFSITLSPYESFNKFELLDNQRFYVSGGSVTIKTYTGLFN